MSRSSVWLLCDRREWEGGGRGERGIERTAVVAWKEDLG